MEERHVEEKKRQKRRSKKVGKEMCEGVEEGGMMEPFCEANVNEEPNGER